MTEIAIIGSGIAGLACARALADAGLSPVVFDKGRGVGGRVATRRGDGGLQFDHGAQHISAQNAEFASVLKDAKAQDFVEIWSLPDAKDRYVGTPGMTGFAKYLGQDVDVRQGTQITAITPSSEGWRLAADRDLGRFDVVVCTAPAPQSEALVGGHLGQGAGFDKTLYAPCLTLMVALHTAVDLPHAQQHASQELSWIAKDSVKPGRPDAECWVVQADAAWSARHLELTKEEIGTLMLDLFLSHAGLAPTDVIHAAAHRWRYAMVTTPVGVPFLKSASGTLYAGGDWCIGPKVEDAWLSGTSIARDVLGKS